MKQPQHLSRRSALAAMAGAAGTLAVLEAGAQDQPKPETAPLKGRIKQSVSYWCYGKIPLDDFCKQAKAMGLVGIDLLDPKDWPVVKSNGLIATMCSGPGSIGQGWNDPKAHKSLIEKGEKRLQEVADAGLPNMIVFSGNRRGMADDEGLKNCVKGLKHLMPLAEKLGVNVVMELLNSKRDHKDYMCDHTAWGVALAKELGSPRFKLLHDIYHMQIMEGDIIQTLTENLEYIGHVHTGGVPGRHEIDDSQELNYRRICQALADAGFQGYVAHEFTPTNPDPLASLRQAIAICDV